MKITYTPNGEPPQAFDVGVNTLTTDEAEEIEEAGGVQWDTFGSWGVKLYGGSFKAWRVALWIMLRRSNPALLLEQVTPSVGEIAFTVDDEDEPPEPDGEPGKSEPDDSPTDST